MDNTFNIPEEHTSSDDAARRTMDLIEEIRADLDFELDDAVTTIVRNLPENYFNRISRSDQVMHLKGLIASRICELNDELFLNGKSGSEIAVLGRSNYRGQLAAILAKLPSRTTRLVGADIYTSKSHDFILDVFEFETDETARESSGINEEAAVRIADETNTDISATRDFLSRIRTTTQATNDFGKLKRYFLAHQSLDESQLVSIDVMQNADSQDSSVVVGVRAKDERFAFRMIADYLANHSLDIEQAELVIVRFTKPVDEAPEVRSTKSVLMFFELDNSDGSVQIDASQWAAEIRDHLGRT